MSLRQFHKSLPWLPTAQQSMDYATRSFSQSTAALSRASPDARNVCDVTLIETGKVIVKEAQAVGKSGRSAIMRKLDMARDNRWTEPWPIFAFLIRHSTGNYLVDTGDTWRNSVPGYLPKLIRDNVKVLVAAHEEIGQRLRDMGLDPDKDIKSVLMSHLHHDHAGGLHHFPHSRILVSAENYKEATSLIGSRLGYLPKQWPVWFKPELFDYQPIPVGPFAESLPITEDGAITIVPTPGHAPGHASIIVKGSDGITYFIGADVSYSEKNIRDNVADGVTWQPELSLQTLGKVREFAGQQPTIILCSHDPTNWERMENGQVYTRAQ